MQLSTRGRYALRAMVDLALHSGEGLPVSRHDIATRQKISPHYVAQLFRKLAKAGLVKGVKGPGGGYSLARPAGTIRAGDVVRAVEGPIAVVACTFSGSECPWKRADECVTRLLWKRLSEATSEVLDSVTLEELCEQARKLSKGSWLYCI